MMTQQPKLEKNIKNRASADQQIISISAYSNTDEYIAKLDEATNIFTLSVYLLDYDGITDSFYILGGCAGCTPSKIYSLFKEYIIKAQQNHINQEGVGHSWGFEGQIQVRDFPNKEKTRTKINKIIHSANWELNDGTGFNKLRASVSAIDKLAGERLNPEFFIDEDADAVRYFFNHGTSTKPF